VSTIRLIVAVPTPFKTFSVDYNAFASHIQWLEQNGIDSILLAGTTGEFFSLTIPEKVKLMQIARKNFSGAILINTSESGLGSTIRLLGQLLEFKPDGVFLLPPFYLQSVSAQGIVDYCNTVAKKCTVPLYLYNFPKHTQQKLTSHMLTHISHSGLKDSEPDYSLIPATPAYYCGSERHAFSVISRGGAGFVCVRAAAFPRTYLAFKKLLEQSCTKKQMQKQLQQMQPIADFLRGPDEIANLKAVLEEKIAGYPPDVRLPLVAYRGLKNRINALITQFG